MLLSSEGRGETRNMAYYSIDKSSKKNIEKKVVTCLGDRSMYNAYRAGIFFRNVKQTGLLLISVSLICLLVGFIAMTQDHWLSCLLIAGIVILLLSLVSVLFGDSLSMFFLGEVSKITYDLKYVFSSKNDKIEIAEYGVSNFYLYYIGDEDEPAQYRKDVVEKQDISEILHCEMLGAYAVCGKVTTYYSTTAKALSDPENVQWMFCNSKTALSMRIFDYWKNDETGRTDAGEMLSFALGIPVREVGAEEFQQCIEKDEILRIGAKK